jgi:hypothetical protein
MDCKIMQKSLIINRFEWKKQSFPTKRLAKVQLYTEIQRPKPFFFNYLRLEEIEQEKLEAPKDKRKEFKVKRQRR